MEQQHRHIVHFDLDTFFVSVERLKDSRLMGIPLIVGGGERGVVAACSYEARAFGVRSAMPMRQARQLCPHARVIAGDYEHYEYFSSLVTTVIEENVPAYEKASIDEFYADLTGMDKFFSTGKFVRELKTKILQATGLPISYALASNKLVSKVATNEVKPNGATVIPLGTERGYLAPLTVQKMPGVGPVTQASLHKMGLNTFQLLADFPVQGLLHKFGKTGSDLSRRARGIDDSPIVPYREQQSISSETTFNSDTTDMAFLVKEVVRLTEKIGFELRTQEKLTGCVTLKVRYNNFDTVTKQIAIPYTQADDKLITVAKTLFEQLYERRMAVRLLGVRFTKLVAGTYQISLFDDTQENIALYRAIDSIKQQYGASAILRARGV